MGVQENLITGIALANAVQVNLHLSRATNNGRCGEGRAIGCLRIEEARGAKPDETLSLDAEVGAC